MRLDDVTLHGDALSHDHALAHHEALRDDELLLEDRDRDGSVRKRLDLARVLIVRVDTIQLVEALDLPIDMLADGDRLDLGRR